MTVRARAVHAAVAGALALVSQTGDASCDVTPTRACGIWFHEMQVHHNVVSETVTPSCATPARWHILHAWIEYRRVGEFSRLGGRDTYTEKLPSANGFDVEVSISECLEGWYRAGVRTEGQLRPTPEIPHPQEFDTTLYGGERYVTLEDCRT